LKRKGIFQRGRKEGVDVAGNSGGGQGKADFLMRAGNVGNSRSHDRILNGVSKQTAYWGEEAMEEREESI